MNRLPNVLASAPQIAPQQGDEIAETQVTVAAIAPDRDRAKRVLKLGFGSMVGDRADERVNAGAQIAPMVLAGQVVDAANVAPNDAHRIGRGHVSRYHGIALAASLALAGCAHSPPIRYAAVSCLSADQLNALKAQEPPKIRSLLNGDAEHDLKLIAGNDIRMRAWAQGLLTVLSGCAGK